MGHITAVADSPDQAIEFVTTARKALTSQSCSTKEQAPVSRGRLFFVDDLIIDTDLNIDTESSVEYVNGTISQKRLVA